MDVYCDSLYSETQLDNNLLLTCRAVFFCFYLRPKTGCDDFLMIFDDLFVVPLCSILGFVYARKYAEHWRAYF